MEQDLSFLHDIFFCNRKKTFRSRLIIPAAGRFKGNTLYIVERHTVPECRSGFSTFLLFHFASSPGDLFRPIHRRAIDNVRKTGNERLSQRKRIANKTGFKVIHVSAVVRTVNCDRLKRDKNRDRLVSTSWNVASFRLIYPNGGGLKFYLIFLLL